MEIPCDFNSLAGPKPERYKSCGELRAPALKITSPRVNTFVSLFPWKKDIPITRLPSKINFVT